MLALFNWRLWALASIFIALSATHFVAYKSGEANERAECTAEKLAASEATRQREKALTIANQGVDRAYQADKARRAAADRITADSLRNLQAELATRPDDTATTTSGIDDPHRDIASQCAGALQRLDSYASGLAVKAAGLQAYTLEVCLKATQ